MEETVLIYIEKDNNYLMLHRTKKLKDLNKDKWLGIGGHIEACETIEQALLREVFEETGLTLLNYQKRGIILFENNNYFEKIHLYTSNSFKGTIKDCDEGELIWINKDLINTLNLWPGDLVFLDKLRNNEDYFEIKLIYENDIYKGCEGL